MPAGSSTECTNYLLWRLHHFHTLIISGSFPGLSGVLIMLTCGFEAAVSAALSRCDFMIFSNTNVQTLHCCNNDKLRFTFYFHSIVIKPVSPPFYIFSIIIITVQMFDKNDMLAWRWCYNVDLITCMSHINMDYSCFLYFPHVYQLKVHLLNCSDAFDRITQSSSTEWVCFVRSNLTNSTCKSTCAE